MSEFNNYLCSFSSADVWVADAQQVEDWEDLRILVKVAL